MLSAFGRLLMLTALGRLLMLAALGRLLMLAALGRMLMLAALDLTDIANVCLVTTCFSRNPPRQPSSILKMS